MQMETKGETTALSKDLMLWLTANNHKFLANEVFLSRGRFDQWNVYSKSGPQKVL